LYKILDQFKCKQHPLNRERAIERLMESFAKKLWPWSESKLIFLICLLAVLDFVSTYAFLTFGNPQVIEGGLLAAWALQTGGFLKLFLLDLVFITILILLATHLREIYSKFGFQGLGHTAFVFLLVPYFIVIMAVVYNNIFWALI
jgi:hypothetical protein